MADHYFAVTSSGSGTGADADNPQAYSAANLNTAESHASGGDTIFFLPGSYGAPPVFDPGKDDITYQSTEMRGAVFANSTDIALGSASRNGLSLIGFKFVDCGTIISSTAFVSTTANIIKQNLFIQNTPLDYGNNGFLLGYSASSKTIFTDNSVITNFNVDAKLFRHLGPWTIERNSFVINTTNVTTLSVEAGSLPSGMKNNIWKSNDASVFDASVALNANSTHSCFYQMGSHNAATETNIEADPLFVDAAGGDLRLRPSSPAIGGIQTFPQQAGGIYISPNGAGDNSGDSQANAINWDSGSGLGEAENLAGSNGTIYFLNGSYPFGENKTFAGANGLTYESLNLHGAVLGDPGTTRRFTIGSASIDGIKINKFKTIDVQDFSQYGAGVSNNKMDQCLITSTVAMSCSSRSVFYTNSGGLDVTNTAISPFIKESGFRFFSSPSRLTFNNCTFYIKTDGTLTEKISFMGDIPTASFLKNTIFVCDNASNVSTSVYPSSGTAGNFAYFATNCCFFQMGSANTSGGTNNLFNVDPKFVDSNLGDFRIRPDSPLISGFSESKYSSDTIWVDSASVSAGTGTESNPFNFNGGSNSKFNDAVEAAVSNGTFQVVFKDGNYTFDTAGEQLRAPNLGLVTLVAENPHKAIITGSGLNIGSMQSQTLNMKDMVFQQTDNRFIENQNVNFIFTNCYVTTNITINPSLNGSFDFKNCIVEKSLNSTAAVFTTAPGKFTNCLFIDRNASNDQRFDQSTTTPPSTFKNCIFRSEQPGNPRLPAYGALINCAVYNYDASSYNDEEVILDGDPMMVNFDPLSHENSNYQLRPSSPLIGKGK